MHQHTGASGNPEITKPSQRGHLARYHRDQRRIFAALAAGAFAALALAALVIALGL